MIFLSDGAFGMILATDQTHIFRIDSETIEPFRMWVTAWYFWEIIDIY